MVVGVVGLGLIGGSAAKAFKAAGHTIYAYDINESVTGFAVWRESLMRNFRQIISVYATYCC